MTTYLLFDLRQVTSSLCALICSHREYLWEGYFEADTTPLQAWKFFKVSIPLGEQSLKFIANFPGLYPVHSLLACTFSPRTSKKIFHSFWFQWDSILDLGSVFPLDSQGNWLFLFSLEPHILCIYPLWLFEWLLVYFKTSGKLQLLHWNSSLGEEANNESFRRLRGFCPPWLLGHGSGLARITSIQHRKFGWMRIKSILWA